MLSNLVILGYVKKKPKKKHNKHDVMTTRKVKSAVKAEKVLSVTDATEWRDCLRW